MSIGRRGVPHRRRTTTNIQIPSVKIPRILAGTRNPAGWGSTDVKLRARGAPGALNPRRPEPAGEPPSTWDGTKPEWAIYWALEKLGMLAGEDFYYRPRLPANFAASGEAEVDFIIPDRGIGIEIQGRFWHYGQGSRKVVNDIMRVNSFALLGIKIIFIDEPDAVSDPIHFAKEALEGNDHSHVNRVRQSIQI